MGAASPGLEDDLVQYSEETGMDSAACELLAHCLLSVPS